jgi:long-chain acyl-CoA synthetase
MTGTPDTIRLDADGSLCELLGERLRRSPDAVAYRQVELSAGDWVPWTWQQVADHVSRWQQAFLQEGLQPGDRVAVMLPNCRDWVAFDMAAQGLGLVVVPLYLNDRPDNMALILEDCGASLLAVCNDERWQALAPVEGVLSRLQRVVSLQRTSPLPGGLEPVNLSDWLPDGVGELRIGPRRGADLASIVYTSGTTGRPKGVMLSHRNILANVFGVLELIHAYREDVFLSFLPLSHMLERTGGYYLPMAAGASVAYARSPQKLMQDFQRIRPTVIISVPRVFERVYAKFQEKLAQEPAALRVLFRAALRGNWEHYRYSQGRGGWRPWSGVWQLFDKLTGARVREALGGNLRCAVAGGAAMAPEVTKFFIGAGLPLLQGYGSTETSPVVAVNTMAANIPDSVGRPLPEVEVKIGARDELLTRGPSVMLGYWNDPDATAACIDSDGWFHTGDCARIEQGHVFITGRIKEIIVLANGEKVSPADMEMAICMDSLIGQALVLGEGRPYLSALVVLEPAEYAKLARSEGLADLASETENPRLKQILVQRIAARLKEFPGYAKIPRVAVMKEAWTVESGLLTPTLKPKRQQIFATNSETIASLYAGH